MLPRIYCPQPGPLKFFLYEFHIFSPRSIRWISGLVRNRSWCSDTKFCFTTYSWRFNLHRENYILIFIFILSSIIVLNPQISLVIGKKYSFLIHQHISILTIEVTHSMRPYWYKRPQKPHSTHVKEKVSVHRLYRMIMQVWYITLC